MTGLCPAQITQKKGSEEVNIFFTLMVPGVTFKGEDYMCYGLH